MKRFYGGSLVEGVISDALKRASERQGLYRVTFVECTLADAHDAVGDRDFLKHIALVEGVPSDLRDTGVALGSVALFGERYREVDERVAVRECVVLYFLYAGGDGYARKYLAVHKCGVADLFKCTVGTEFDRFGDVLEATQKRLEQTSSELDKLVGVRTRQIRSKLRTVTSLPQDEAAALFDGESADGQD